MHSLRPIKYDTFHVSFAGSWFFESDDGADGCAFAAPKPRKRSVQPRVMANSAPLYNRLIQLGTRSFEHELGKN
jgi:hypothetical protein